MGEWGIQAAKQLENPVWGSSAGQQDAPRLGNTYAQAGGSVLSRILWFSLKSGRKHLDVAQRSSLHLP